MSNCPIGFELLLQCVKQDIAKKEDIILLLVHHSLLRAGFKCAGSGENWSENDSLSELLPNGWNTSKEYILRYKRDGDSFILMSNRTDDVIVFNFTSPEKMKVSNVIFNVADSVHAIAGCISTMAPQYETILQKITQELITPFQTPQKVDTNTQTVEEAKKVRVIQATDPFTHDFARSGVRYEDINAVGRRDLDPLAAMGGAGGMIFDPLRENRYRLLGGLGAPQRLPRGAIPPGARFDPFGPPDNLIHGRPPPGYDDMFG